MRDSILKNLQEYDTGVEHQLGEISKEKAEAKAKRRLEKHKKAVLAHSSKNARRAVHFGEQQAPQ